MVNVSNVNEPKRLLARVPLLMPAISRPITPIKLVVPKSVQACAPSFERLQEASVNGSHIVRSHFVNKLRSENKVEPALK